MTSNPRQTRAGGNHDAANAQPTDARQSKTFLDKWVEPPLRPPAPSFMDNPHQDIIRHGVLSTMAPLGTLPSSKVKKLAKTDGPRRLAFVKKGEQSVSAASTPREAVTPEPQVIPSGGRSESHKMDDVEWNPTTPLAQSSSLKGTPYARQTSPLLVSPYSTTTSPTHEEFDVDRTDRAVEWAVTEAVATGRLPTGYALRSMFDDYRSNPRIVRLYSLISTQEATEEEHAEFRSLMHYKKKEGRTSKKAEQMFAHVGLVPSTPVQFSAVNYKSSGGNVVPEATTDLTRSPHKASEGPLHKKHKATHLDGSKHHHNHLKVNGNGALVNGARSRSRSNSASSSDSDLSSIDEARLTENRRVRSVFSELPEEAASKSHGTKTEPLTATADSDVIGRRINRTRPMASRKTLGPKLEAWDSNTNSGAPSSLSSAPSSASLVNNHNSPSQDMPTAASDSSITQAPDDLSTQPPSQVPQPSGLKSLKKNSRAAAARDVYDDDRALLKRKARDITENCAQVHESFDRHRVVTRGAEPKADGGNIAAVGQTSRSGQILRFRSSQANKRLNDESDDLSSPTLPSFMPDGAPTSSSNSRAGTPSVLNRPSRKPKRGLRMKTSPMKKKTGPSAGIPRASGERNSPIGSGTLPHNQDDNNDDYCSSCGGNGDLVCCDGCTRSFHFKCVDPPLSESQLPDIWFCNHCNALRNPGRNDDRSVFGQLFEILQKKNPSAFHLPKDFREYFEGVRTGVEGEYEEGVPQKPKRTAGYEEPPDYLKLKDAKGHFILCHKCHKGTGDGNPIIPCSYCSLQWHLDCLDPPLANPPPQGKPWRCPCHVDDLLAKVPGALEPAHRFRKIKGVSITRPAFARGFRNDGHIEVEFAPSDEEDEGFFERKEYGKVYKLPEDGIKLDFISRVRSIHTTHDSSNPSVVSGLPTKRRFAPADRHSIQERQAALNVAQLATQDDNSDGAQTLIDALLSQASPSVIALMAQGDASKIANKVVGQSEKQSLLAMKALIEQTLQQMDQDPNPMNEKEPAKIKEEPTADDDVDMLI